MLWDIAGCIAAVIGWLLVLANHSWSGSRRLESTSGLRVGRETDLYEVGRQIANDSRRLLKRATWLADHHDERLAQAFRDDLGRHLKALDSYCAALDTFHHRRGLSV